MEEALKIRGILKASMDSEENPINMSLDPIYPFKGSDEIKLIIIGQDPTIKNEKQRVKIKTTLNLNRGGSLKTYITGICESLGIKLGNIYATNVFKYFYRDPPARTPSILHSHLNPNLKLLKEELLVFPDIPIITLGEPVLQLLSNKTGDKVREYWDYKKGISGNAFKKCIDNNLGRSFFPFPHQPSAGRKFYAETMNEYLNFVKKDFQKK